jgi:hypothetical protein
VFLVASEETQVSRCPIIIVELKNTMTLCSKWAKMEPCRRSMTNYGPQALQLSSKFRFLRGSTVAFPSNQQQMEYLHFRFVVTCSRKGGKGSGRSKKKAFRGKVVDRVVLPDSRETAVRGMNYICAFDLLSFFDTSNDILCSSMPQA